MLFLHTVTKGRAAAQNEPGAVRVKARNGILSRLGSAALPSAGAPKRKPRSRRLLDPGDFSPNL
jgi:hypothetical protein